MRAHIRVIAWLHIVFGILTTVMFTGAGVVMVFFAEYIPRFSDSPAPGSASPGADGDLAAFPLILQFSISHAGWILFGLALVLGLPGVVEGIGLLRLKRWSRVGGIVVSALDFLYLNPLHIAMGIYGLVILCSREAIDLFENGRAGAESGDRTG